MYTVIKPFTYAGKAYARGDTWTPAGHRNDQAIVNTRMVMLPVAARASRPRVRPPRRAAPEATS